MLLSVPKIIFGLNPGRNVLVAVVYVKSAEGADIDVLPRLLPDRREIFGDSAVGERKDAGGSDSGRRDIRDLAVNLLVACETDVDVGIGYPSHN